MREGTKRGRQQLDNVGLRNLDEREEKAGEIKVRGAVRVKVRVRLRIIVLFFPRDIFSRY